MADFDYIVIGAGVVGLAVGRALARNGRTVLIAEADARHGNGVSSRSSEVIHAGLYYPHGSLKARLCLRGRELLYRYCREHAVAHRQVGKWIVATEAGHVGELEAIAAAAHGNGATEVRPLALATIRAEAPALRAVAALESPRTGIVDSQGLMLALLGDAEDAGAVLALRCRFLGAAPEPDRGHAVRFAIGDGPAADEHRLACRWLVNCAGLSAPAVASRIDGLPAASIPVARYAKGHYFALAGRSPFSRLIYPVPEPGGLGVHLTLDLGGQARFGPDVEWVDVPSYDVPAARSAGFESVIRRYWPGLPDGALQPAYAGVRPKITGPGAASADFRIDGPAAHGVEGIVNLFGIESPGLTASLAIADLVQSMLAAAD